MCIINQMIENLYSYKISYQPNHKESFCDQISIFDQNFNFLSQNQTRVILLNTGSIVEMFNKSGF